MSPLGKLLNLLEPQFPHRSSQDNSQYPTHKADRRIKWITECKALGIRQIPDREGWCWHSQRSDDRQKVAKASAPSACKPFLHKCNYTTCLKNRKRKPRQLNWLLCKILTLVRFQSFFFLLYTSLIFLYNKHMLMFLITKVMFFLNVAYLLLFLTFHKAFLLTFYKWHYPINVPLVSYCEIFQKYI